MSNRREFEEPILRSIEARTGLRFGALYEIQRQSEEVRALLFPTLAEWVDRMPASGARANLYFLLDVASLSHQMERLLRWWEGEPDPIHKSCLTMLVVQSMRKAQAEMVWRAYTRSGGGTHKSFLLRRLAGAPRVREAVIQEVLRILREEEPLRADLREYGKIGDVRVQEVVRAKGPVMGRRAARGGVSGLRRQATGPDRRLEVFSTDVDLADVREVLQWLKAEYGIVFDPLIDLGLLGTEEEAGWFLLPCLRRRPQNLEVYLRNEDETTVEIVVVRC